MLLACITIIGVVIIILCMVIPVAKLVSTLAGILRRVTATATITFLSSLLIWSFPVAKLMSTPAGILRRTSIELGSGTVSFDVSLLSDLTGQQRAIMTNLQVCICYSFCLGHMTQHHSSNVFGALWSNALKI